MRYPECFYTRDFEYLFKAMPPIPAIPKEPKKPKLPNEPKESDFKPDYKVRRFMFFMFILPIILLFLYFTTDALDFFSTFYIVILFAAAIILGLLFFSFFSDSFSWRDQYHEAIRNYRNELNNYPDELKKHAQDVEKYRTDLINYQKDVDNINMPSNVLKYRRDELSKLLSKAKLPKTAYDKEIKKGVSENWFHNLLYDRFGDKICTDLCLEDGNVKYCPDIVYWDENNSILIDIEIDEPYVGANGDPIHYIIKEKIDTRAQYYSKNQISVDNDRNMFFIYKRWFIIRFAEEQIIRHNEKCLDFVSEFIGKIYNVEDPKEILVDDNFFISKWTMEESIRMAYIKYRNNYLPEHLKINLTQETFEDVESNDSQSYDDLQF